VKKPTNPQTAIMIPVPPPIFEAWSIRIGWAAKPERLPHDQLTPGPSNKVPILTG
jgi:hypothetical protein